MRNRKLWVFVLLFSFINTVVIAGNPEVRINETFTNIPLKEALSILKEKYDLKIAYGDQLISDITINATIENLTVLETFRILLNETTLTFEMLDENLIIVHKSKKDPTTYFSLTGVVQDAVSGERLPHAYVWLEDSKTNLVTNVDGYFTFQGNQLPLRITISYLGYQDTTFTVNDKARNKRLYVNLLPGSFELDELVITEEQNDDFTETGKIGKLDINPEIAYSVPSVGETDLLRTLQLLPGINATNENSAGLSIQGGTANQNLFLFDGFTVYHVDHFFGYFSAFNPFAVKSINLYKAAYDASLGGRVSGVVDISGKEGNLKELSGSLSANLLSINSSLEIPLVPNKTSLFFSARRSYTDIIGTSLFEEIFSNFTPELTQNAPAVNPGNGGGMHGQGGMGQEQRIEVLDHSLKPDFYYSDLNFRISSKIGLKNHFSFSFYDSNDLLNFTESTRTAVNDTLTVSEKSIGVINWGNIGTSAKWSRLWNSSQYSNFLLSYSHYKSTYDDLTNTTSVGSDQVSEFSSSATEQRNEIRDVTLKIDHEWFMTNNQSIHAGVHSTLYGTRFKNVTDTLEIVNESLDNKAQISVFGSYEFRLADRLQLNLGFRENYYAVTRRWYPEPRISASLNINESFRVKGAFGIHHQFINQSNTKNALQGSRDFWLLADNDRIPVQRAEHYMAGAEYHRGEMLISGEFFRRNFTGLLEYAFSNGGLITEFPNYDELFFDGEGYSEGFELLIKRSAPAFNAWAGYTMSVVKQRFDDLNNSREFYADHDQRHEVNLYGSWKWRKWEFFSTWIYGSGKPYSQNSAFGNSDDPHVMLIEEGEKNNGRLPEYHRMDMGVAYKTKWNNVSFQSTLSFFNIYNRQNVLEYTFTQMKLGGREMLGHGGSNSIAQATTTHSMGITPNLTVVIGFN